MSDHPNSHSGFRIRQGSHLPHWTLVGAIYAVNFRLADSIPQDVLRQWKHEKEVLLHASRKEKRALTPDEERRLILHTERLDVHLDNGRGASWMMRDDIAEIVASALTHFDGSRYRQLAWCVMPTHVHAIFKPLEDHTVDRILHSWKSFTSKACNKRLNRSGQFWSDEYYDHIVRSEEELRKQIEYVLNNPLKAGLENWKWVGCNLEGANFTG